MPLDARQAVYALCQKHGVIIFEDDPYGDLLYEGEAIPKMKSFDESGLVIYSGSFSKILAPSTRLGFLVVPKAVYPAILLGKQATDSHTNQYWQLVAAKLMTDYDFEGHIERLRLFYRERFYAMLESLDALDTALLTYIRPQGGYFLCAKMADDVNVVKFYDYLVEQRVAVIPGNVMSVTQEGWDQYFRLNFTKPTVSEIRKGIAIIGDALVYATTENRFKEGA
jgi:2-aminoadipate transaminase